MGAADFDRACSACFPRGGAVEAGLGGEQEALHMEVTLPGDKQDHAQHLQELGGGQASKDVRPTSVGWENEQRKKAEEVGTSGEALGIHPVFMGQSH